MEDVLFKTGVPPFDIIMVHFRLSRWGIWQLTWKILRISSFFNHSEAAQIQINCTDLSNPLQTTPLSFENGNQRNHSVHTALPFIPLVSSSCNIVHLVLLYLADASRLLYFGPFWFNSIMWLFQNIFEKHLCC